MRRIVFLVFVLAAFLSTTVQAQLKMGYANTDSILVKLPEYKIQQKQLETYGKQLQTQLQAEQAKAQKRFEELQAKAPNMTPDERQKAQAELLKLDEDLQKRGVLAQSKMAAREQELLKPLFEKVQKGIEEVAKEKGYTYILSEQMFIYKTEVDDITQLVIAKIKG
ncbi:MAG: OmpH family outer membrane protein [Flammeovirgaceae bacterium]